MGDLGELVARIDARLESVEDVIPEIRKKLDGISGWLMGVMGSLIIALVLLVLNMLRDRR